MSNEQWMRVSRNHRCPICTKIDWCLISADDPNNPSACICARIQEGSQRYLEACGYLHFLREREKNWKPLIRRIPKQTPKDLTPIAKEYVNAVQGKLGPLSDTLGVSVKTLQRLRVGWTDLYQGSWSFPMRNSKMQVIGIRLRLQDGTKLSVRGGREGLFIPQGVGCDKQLIICEGPTDTAALMDLWFNVVGRPNCQGGTKYIKEIVKHTRPDRIVIMADADGPGRKGAEELAKKLDKYKVVVVEPPGGKGDIREWVNSGASKQDIQQAINKEE